MKSLNLRKMVPVIVMAFLITGSVVTYNLVFDNIRRANNIDLGREIADAAYQLKDQFQIQNKHYILLSEVQKSEFKFSEMIRESDIGEQITTITTSIDESLKGLAAYKYLPAGGEAVVAVKKDSEYLLFKFLAFESYNKNQDEDVSAYLKLYGINSAADIEKVQFIGNSEQAKIEGKLHIISEITDSGKIKAFYNYYSVIKNSSDQYFEKLFGYKSIKKESQNKPPETKELPPDYKEGAVVDLPTSSGSSVEVHYADDSKSVKNEKGASYDKGVTTQTAGRPGSAGDALNNSVTIRIYNQSGLYLDAEYYPNIRFISRHEVKEDFASFLKGYIGF